MYTVYVICNFDNTEPYIAQLTSKKPINLERTLQYIEKTVDNINWEKDSITLIQSDDVDIENID